MKTILRVAVAVFLLAFTSPALASEWYISSIIGIGDLTKPMCTTENPCAPALDVLLGPGWDSASEGYTRDLVMNSDTHNWALMKITYADYSEVNGKPGVSRLPDYPFDAKMNAMAQATRTALTATLTTYNIPTTCLTGADGYRDVIRCIGRVIKPEFNEADWGN